MRVRLAAYLIGLGWAIAAVVTLFSRKSGLMNILFRSHVKRPSVQAPRFSGRFARQNLRTRAIDKRLGFTLPLRLIVLVISIYVLNFPINTNAYAHTPLIYTFSWTNHAITTCRLQGPVLHLVSVSLVLLTFLSVSVCCTIFSLL